MDTRPHLILSSQATLLLPRDLCTCCSLCPECPSPSYLPGLLSHCPSGEEKRAPFLGLHLYNPASFLGEPRIPTRLPSCGVSILVQGSVVYCLSGGAVVLCSNPQVLERVRCSVHVLLMSGWGTEVGFPRVTQPGSGRAGMGSPRTRPHCLAGAGEPRQALEPGSAPAGTVGPARERPPTRLGLPWGGIKSL